MAGKIPGRIPETKSLIEILPQKSAASGREFARIVNLLLTVRSRWSEILKMGQELFVELLVKLRHAQDAFLCLRQGTEIRRDEKEYYGAQP